MAQGTGGSVAPTGHFNKQEELSILHVDRNGPVLRKMKITEERKDMIRRERFL